MKRRILAVVFMLAATFALLSAGPQRRACALPACDILRNYYADNTFSGPLVGQYHVTCYGITRWGNSTYYYDHLSLGACGASECLDWDYRCENGTITDASDPRYIGNSCPNYPVF